MDQPRPTRKTSLRTPAITILAVCVALALGYAAGAYVERRNAPPPPPVQPLEGNALRVMTYNVHVDGSRDGDNPWSIRRDLVASVIRFHQADVAGLQEASMDMIDDLDKRLTEVTWARRGVSEKLDVEGQGTATISYGNVYKDRITVTVERKNGLWYLTGVETKFNKELPEKPKDD